VTQAQVSKVAGPKGYIRATALFTFVAGTIGLFLWAYWLEGELQGEEDDNV
jgi:hypothetical protein